MKSSILDHPFKLEVIIIRCEWPNSVLYKKHFRVCPAFGAHFTLNSGMHCMGLEKE
jgi:hypothetical protein